MLITVRLMVLLVPAFAGANNEERLMKSRSRVILSVLLLMTMLATSAVIVQANGQVLEEVEQQSAFALPILVVNTENLNIRTGPGAQYTRLAVARGGTELPVLGVARDRVWYLVSTSVGNGWVNVAFTLPRGNFTNVPLIDTSNIQAPLAIDNPATLGLPGQGGGAIPGIVVPGQGGAASPGSSVPGGRVRAKINVPAVNLRTAPVAEASTIQLLFGADDILTDYAIVGQATDIDNVAWIALEVPGVGSGWLEAEKTRPSLNALYKPVLVVQAGAVAVAASPAGGGDLPVLPPGTEVFLVSLSEDGSQIQVELLDGRLGWIPFESVRPRSGTTTDVLARQQGLTGQMPQFSSSNVVAGQGGGSTVTTSGVSVPANQAALAAPVAIVNTPVMNIRSGPGAQFTAVTTVPGGTSLTVLGFARDEVWWLVSGAFGQGWVNREYVLFRGDLNNVLLVRDAAANAVLARPKAVISTVVPIRLAPRSDSTEIGAAVGPVELEIVARTPDFNWVQLQTPFGFGWVPAELVIIRGDGALIPIVN
jgi:uncharacterized protein YraI